MEVVRIKICHVYPNKSEVNEYIEILWCLKVNLFLQKINQILDAKQYALAIREADFHCMKDNFQIPVWVLVINSQRAS